jgi:predicted N-acetyltransferase YhbS
MIPTSMEIRTLRRGEREALLELLDGWELPDGWRGRDFFRRYVEDDPTFADENVWVAAEDGALVSCVQIFPRALRIAGTQVAAGGIGSVFTRPEARRRGIAEAVFARAMEAMRERGLAVGLLFGDEAIYARQGWRAWGVPAGLLVRAPGDAEPPAAAPPGVVVAGVERSRDLADVQALHARFSDLLPGTVVRDDALWEASLRNAGNPDEEFLVARAGGELVAYARATLHYGFVSLMEFGAEPGFEPALAALAARVLSPREADPWERSGRPTEELRRLAVTVRLGGAPDLAAALARAKLVAREAGDTKAMLRCLDPGALAARVGERPRPSEAPNDFLARLLPPADLTFWPADRF